MLNPGKRDAHRESESISSTLKPDVRVTLANDNKKELSEITVFDTVILESGERGRVVFIGDVHFDDNKMLGIELEKWSPNGHNGSIYGKTYFVAREGHGLLVPMEAIYDVDRRKQHTDRYADDTFIVCQNVIISVPFACENRLGPMIRDQVDNLKRADDSKSDEHQLQLHVGDLVRVETGRIGMVRYIGKSDFSEDKLVGIALDSWSRDAGDGSICGQQLFKTSAGRGYFTHYRFVTDIMCRSKIADFKYARLKGLDKTLWLNDETVKIICYDDKQRHWKVKRTIYAKSTKKYMYVQREQLEILIMDPKPPNKMNCGLDESLRVEPKVGDRVRTRTGRLGTVKYVGDVAFANGNTDRRIGLTLDQRHPNGHNGTVDGRKYFAVKADGRGYFVTLDDLIENIGPKRISRKMRVQRRLHRVRRELRHIEILEFKQKCGVRLHSNDISMVNRKEELRVKVGDLMKTLENYAVECAENRNQSITKWISHQGQHNGIEPDEAKLEDDQVEFKVGSEHDSKEDLEQKQYDAEQLITMCRIDPVDHQLSRMEKIMKLTNDIDISKYIFMARCGRHETQEYRFENLSEFQISCQSLFQWMDVPCPVNIYVKSTESDEVSDFVRIASMMKSRYVFKRDTPLRITESIVIPPADRGRRHNGYLNIQCTSDIVIAPNLRTNNNRNHGGTNPVVFNNKESALMLLSNKNIENHDFVCSADIFAVADSFVNDGKMECASNGQIIVICKTFHNNGVMDPPPTILLLPDEKQSLSDLKAWVASRRRSDSQGCSENFNLHVRDDWIFPLMTALRTGEGYTFKDDVELLLQLGAVGRVVQYGNCGLVKMVHQYLLNWKSEQEVNDMMNGRYDGNGCTPLHFACMGGYEDIARYLVDVAKVDIFRKDNYNKTAMDYAVENVHYSIAQWMLIQDDRTFEKSNFAAKEVMDRIGEITDESRFTFFAFLRGLFSLESSFNQNQDVILNVKNEIFSGKLKMSWSPSIEWQAETMDMVVGDYVQLRNGVQGIIKYIGNSESPTGARIGLKMDTWHPDGHDGERHFQCNSGYGMWTARDEILVHLKLPRDMIIQEIKKSLKERVLNLRKKNNESTATGQEEKEQVSAVDIAQIKVGDRVRLFNGRTGIVRWKGTVPRKKRIRRNTGNESNDNINLHFGIEFDVPDSDAHDGKQHFMCPENRGVLAMWTEIEESLGASSVKSHQQIHSILKKQRSVLKVNDRVEVLLGGRGTVRYLGNTDFVDDLMFGIELNHQSLNASNGTVNGIRYFECGQGKGLFVREDSIVEQLKERGLSRLERIPRMHDKVQLIDGQLGVVKFVGQLESSTDIVIGVNLDHWSPNGSNGSADERTYFRCEPGHGYFVGMEHIAHNMGSIISTLLKQSVHIHSVHVPVRSAAISTPDPGDRVRLTNGQLAVIQVRSLRMKSLSDITCRYPHCNARTHSMSKIHR